MTELFWETNLIFKVVCGSRAYGLDTPESDTDTRGVCIPPKRVLLGLQEFEQHVDEGGDHVIYSLVKFVRMALQSNPNIVETLWTDPADVLVTTELGERLVAIRERMLSRRAGQRFMGYALGQLNRMQRHHGWLSNPLKEEPTPEQFGATLVEAKLNWPSDQRQKEFKRVHKRWRQYQDWRKNRNPKRAALEEAHGYDTKHAQHLCRLITMGEEILTEGVVRVRRPDAEWLRGIRDGSMTYEELQAWAREHVAALPDLVASSPLPEKPDTKGVEALVIELQEAFLFG